MRCSFGGEARADTARLFRSGEGGWVECGLRVADCGLWVDRRKGMDDALRCDRLVRFDPQSRPAAVSDDPAIGQPGCSAVCGVGACPHSTANPTGRDLDGIASHARSLRHAGHGARCRHRLLRSFNASRRPLRSASDRCRSLRKRGEGRRLGCPRFGASPTGRGSSKSRAGIWNWRRPKLAMKRRDERGKRRGHARRGVPC